MDDSCVEEEDEEAEETPPLQIRRLLFDAQESPGTETNPAGKTKTFVNPYRTSQNPAAASGPGQKPTEGQNPAGQNPAIPPELLAKPNLDNANTRKMGQAESTRSGRARTIELFDACTRVYLNDVPVFAKLTMENVEADNMQELYRLIAPMHFVQGSRDRTCDLDVLRQTLTRVGAPTSLQVVQEADQHFKVLKKSGRTAEEVRSEILNGVDGWIQKVLGS